MSVRYVSAVTWRGSFGWRGVARSPLIFGGEGGSDWLYAEVDAESEPPLPLPLEVVAAVDRVALRSTEAEWGAPT